MAMANPSPPFCHPGEAAAPFGCVPLLPAGADCSYKSIPATLSSSALAATLSSSALAAALAAAAAAAHAVAAPVDAALLGAGLAVRQPVRRVRQLVEWDGRLPAERDVGRGAGAVQ